MPTSARLAAISMGRSPAKVLGAAAARHGEAPDFISNLGRLDRLVASSLMLG